MPLVGAERLSKALTKIQKQIPDRFTTYHRDLGMKALISLTELTPVDKGRARGAWDVGLGQRPSTERKAPSKSGNRTISDGGGKILRMRPFSVLYITNNVPYIEVLENGGFIPKNPGPSKDKRKDRKGETLVQRGYSLQAPQGMLGRTVRILTSQVLDDLSSPDLT